MKKTIVTISREYGSGGRLIGEMAAKKLEIAFYDRNLIDLVAHKSGFSKDYISQLEEKLSSRFVWRPLVGRSGLILTQNYYSNEDKMFTTQSDIIRELAEKESCVIVGRCADYILQNFAGCLKVFIHAKIDHRIERVVKYYGVESKNAANIIIRTDKGRTAYHNYYTDTKWGDYGNYHLSMESSVFGLEHTADLIVQAVKHMH